MRKVEVPLPGLETTWEIVSRLKSTDVLILMFALGLTAGAAYLSFDLIDVTFKQSQLEGARLLKGAIIGSFSMVYFILFVVVVLGRLVINDYRHGGR